MPENGSNDLIEPTEPPIIGVSDEALDYEAAKPEIDPPPTGFTGKVLKGGFWTLGGELLPMLMSLVTVPVVIRLLGTQSYGVYVLIGLIPRYFSFADLGMGIASTKFGSEAFGTGTRIGEGEVVKTAASVALVSSLTVAVPLILFSYPIIVFFNVPESLRLAASYGLKLTSAAAIFGALAMVFNTPQLARLRMGVNSLIGGIPKMMLAVAIPAALYLGGGIAAAAWLIAIFAGITLAGHIFFSSRVLPELRVARFNSKLLRPLLRFGIGWVLASIAAILLVNLEKLLLTRMVSVESLAHYSVAFTFTAMAGMFSGSLIQSLIPAFSQLNTPDRRDEFNKLYARCIRLIMIWLFPALMVLFVSAKPFFTVWAGQDFGRESSLPFYILEAGLFFNILANVPYSAIAASGRSGIFAKLYWAELIVYALIAAVLIDRFQIAGAAAAWTLRASIDSFLIIWLARRVTGPRFRFADHIRNSAIAVVLLSPPVIFAAVYDNFSLWLTVLTPVCLAAYGLLVWNLFIDDAERQWARRSAAAVFGRI